MDAADPRAQRLALARLALLATAVVAAYVAIAASGPLSVHRARDLVDSGGAWAPLVFVLVSGALTLVSFPGPLLAGAAGVLFGTAGGLPLALAAAAIGATAAHQLGRRAVGRGSIWRDDSRLGLLVARLRGRSFVSILYARILPALPFAVISYAAGVAAIPVRAFLPATVIGAAPRAFAYVSLGGHLDNLGQPQALAAFAILIALALTPPVLAIRRRRRLA